MSIDNVQSQDCSLSIRKKQNRTKNQLTASRCNIQKRFKTKRVASDIKKQTIKPHLTHPFAQEIRTARTKDKKSPGLMNSIPRDSMELKHALKNCDHEQP